MIMNAGCCVSTYPLLKSNAISFKSTLKLNPNWISGIFDGDGTFSYSITKHPHGPLG